MPYAERDAQGRLVALHRSPAPGAAEWLDPADAEVVAFMAAGATQDDYRALDAGFIRVLEDLIDVLLARGLIAVTDLPPEARRKLGARKGRRAPTPLAALNLLGEPEPADDAPRG
jgi:hypothetical protein